MAKLTLYYMESCSYCQKVLSYMKRAGITIPLKSISLDPANRQELFKIGGMAQVPCLVIDGKALYESADIIQWLKENYK